MRLQRVPDLVDLLRADLTESGAMEEMLRHVADLFDVASASIAPAAATTWVPGESFAFNVPDGFSREYPAAQDPTQTFLAGQPGGVFCLGRAFDTSDVLFEVASRYGIDDAAVGNIDVLGAPQMKLILLGDRRFDDTHTIMLRGVYPLLARALSYRERALRPDRPFIDVDQATGEIACSQAARRFLEARFALDPAADGRLGRALLSAASGMTLKGVRTRNFARGVAISQETHPSDREKLTLLLHDQNSAHGRHPAEWLLTVRQRQVARSAAATSRSRAISGHGRDPGGRTRPRRTPIRWVSDPQTLATAPSSPPSAPRSPCSVPV